VRKVEEETLNSELDASLEPPFPTELKDKVLAGVSQHLKALAEDRRKQNNHLCERRARWRWQIVGAVLAVLVAALAATIAVRGPLHTETSNNKTGLHEHVVEVTAELEQLLLQNEGPNSLEDLRRLLERAKDAGAEEKKVRQAEKALKTWQVIADLRGAACTQDLEAELGRARAAGVGEKELETAEKRLTACKVAKALQRTMDRETPQNMEVLQIICDELRDKLQSAEAAGVDEEVLRKARAKLKAWEVVREATIDLRGASHNPPCKEIEDVLGRAEAADVHNGELESAREKLKNCKATEDWWRWWNAQQGAAQAAAGSVFWASLVLMWKRLKGQP